jgi:hypothetical protein
MPLCTPFLKRGLVAVGVTLLVVVGTVACAPRATEHAAAAKTKSTGKDAGTKSLDPSEQTDPSLADEPEGDDEPTDDELAGNEPTEDAGRPTTPRNAGVDASSSAAPCKVSTIPQSMRTTHGLSFFYAKYAGARELPVVASARVPDAALCQARDTILQLTAHRPELLARLGEKKLRLAILGTAEVATDIPEHADLTPKTKWDGYRALGATLLRPVFTSAEENVLCLQKDESRGESTLIMTASFGILEFGVEAVDATFQVRLKNAYDEARAKGLWERTLATRGLKWYFALGAQIWFDASVSRTEPDGVHNHIAKRTELTAYDPKLAALVMEVFGDRVWRYACD